MLILTRRVGETVMIGNEVTVTVLGVKGNQVRLGINAPKDVSVHREEIFERIKAERSDGDLAPGPGESGNGPRNGAGHGPAHGSVNGLVNGASSASGNGAGNGNGASNGNGAINGNGHYNAHS